jgi:hypothetical protein
MLALGREDEVLGEQVVVTGDRRRLVALHGLLDALPHPDHPLGLVGARGVDLDRHAGVVADHVEDADLVVEDGLVVVGADRLDDETQALGVAGDRLGVHGLARDEGHDRAVARLDQVQHRRRHARRRRGHVVVCARARGR